MGSYEMYENITFQVISYAVISCSQNRYMHTTVHCAHIFWTCSRSGGSGTFDCITCSNRVNNVNRLAKEIYMVAWKIVGQFWFVCLLAGPSALDFHRLEKPWVVGWLAATKNRSFALACRQSWKEGGRYILASHSGSNYHENTHK